MKQLPIKTCIYCNLQVAHEWFGDTLIPVTHGCKLDTFYHITKSDWIDKYGLNKPILKLINGGIS